MKVVNGEVRTNEHELEQLNTLERIEEFLRQAREGGAVTYNPGLGEDAVWVHLFRKEGEEWEGQTTRSYLVKLMPFRKGGVR